MSDILVTERISGQALDELARRFDVVVEPELWRDPGALAERIGGTRAVLVRNQTRVTAEIIRAGEGLEVIGRAGVGLDNIDVPAASAAGVVVCYAPEQNAVSVAELAMGMLLSLARKIVVADQDTRNGGWARQAFTGVELFGKTLGVIGFGRIGFLLANRARAFGMRIVAHDPFVSPDNVMVVDSGAEVVSLDELLARADVVSCHLPSTPGTRGFIDAACFGKMKRGAFFLNLARGEVVDEGALIDALQEERLGGAGLDVRAQEPPGPSVLNRMENVILTPHIAAFTEEAQERVVAAVCRDLASVLEGSPAKYPANFARPTARAV